MTAWTDLLAARDARPLPAAWAWAGLLLAGISAALLVARAPVTHCDFVQYYVGARSLAITGDPYEVRDADLGIAGSFPYHTPPILSWLVWPLGALSLPAAGYAWLAANVALTAVLAWLIAAVLVDRGRGRAWAVAFGALMWYPPHTVGLHLGQCHVLIAVALLGGWLLATRGRQVAGGLLLAGAGLVKLFPFLMLPAAWVAGFRRTALVAAGVTLAVVLLTWSQHETYYRSYLAVAGTFYPKAAAFNVSWSGLTARLFTPSEFAVPVADRPALATAGNAVLCAATLAALAWLAWRRPATHRLAAATLCAMLLLSPVAGVYHLNLVLIAVALTVARPAGADSPPRSPGDLLLLIGLLLTCIPTEYGLVDHRSGALRELYRFIHTGWGAVLLTPQTYGVVLIYGAILYRAARETVRPTPVTAPPGPCPPTP